MTKDVDLGQLRPEFAFDHGTFQKAIDDAVRKQVGQKWILEDMWLLSHIKDGVLLFETGPGKDHDWTPVHCGEPGCCDGSVIYYVCRHCKRKEPAQYSQRFNFRFTGLYFGECPGEKEETNA